MQLGSNVLSTATVCYTTKWLHSFGNLFSSHSGYGRCGWLDSQRVVLQMECSWFDCQPGSVLSSWGRQVTLTLPLSSQGNVTKILVGYLQWTGPESRFFKNPNNSTDKPKVVSLKILKTPPKSSDPKSNPQKYHTEFFLTPPPPTKITNWGFYQTHFNRAFFKIMVIVYDILFSLL